MFLIDFVDEHHVFASAGYLATLRLKYLVTNRRVITALLKMDKFPLMLSNVGIKMCMLMDKGPAVQFPVCTRS